MMILLAHSFTSNETASLEAIIVANSRSRKQDKQEVMQQTQSARRPTVTDVQEARQQAENNYTGLTVN